MIRKYVVFISQIIYQQVYLFFYHYLYSNIDIQKCINKYYKSQIYKMAGTYELTQIKDRYLDSLNRVNLLLLRQHDLRRDQRQYKQQLQTINAQILSIQQGRHQPLSLIAQDSHLREQILTNQKQIRRLQKKAKGHQICIDFDVMRSLQNKFLYMISQQFQNVIQQKLSTIRGKVDQLKKKIKEINKEILSYQQQHLQGIDQYSLCLTILREYEENNRALREDIGRLRGLVGKKGY